MSKNFITKDESVEITGWYIEKLLPRFKKFVKHESEHGFWLPKEFETNPVAWVDALKVVETAMEEYIKNKQNENERHSTGPVSSTSEEQ